MPEDSEFYVNIPRPVEVRRSILESSRSVLRGLQAYEDLQELRKEKAQIQALLQKQIKDLQTTIHKLRTTIPYIKQEKKQKEEKKQEVPAKSTPKKQSVPEKSPEMQKLENELSSIEKELASMQG